MDLQATLGNKLVVGALTGVMSAAVVDIVAFRSWKSYEEAAAYNWKLAAWRWFQGAVSGLLTAAGIDIVS